MSFLKYVLIVICCSSFAFAITRQDLEHMKAELDDPITLETIEGILLESGIPFTKVKNQSRCLYYYAHSESHVKTFAISVDYRSYAGKDMLNKIDWTSDYSYYKIVNGRFQSDEAYYQYGGGDFEKRNAREQREKLMSAFNSILDKIESRGPLYWPYSDRCKNCAIQTISSYTLSERLGSQGICNGGYGSEIQTCNYRVNLDDGTVSDVTIEYLLSGMGRDDYTPGSLRFNDNLGIGNAAENSASVKTVKIGKQEWMDHNLLYGEGLTAKYGVGGRNYDESYSVPSGEANSWFVFMDLNLRQGQSLAFVEKPSIKESHQGVCPAGFHVPTRAEWKELFSFVAKDKVKFLKYDLFDEYNAVYNEYEKETGFGWGGSSDKSRKLKKKLDSIENELDAAYSKWRKGKKDGFYCGNGEKCRFNKYDMRNVIEREVVKHLCSKGAWPLDENGEDMCVDSYGFSMLSNSKTGDEMSYWTADAEISKCRDVYVDGRHQCSYDIAGYGFSVKSVMQNFRLSNFETMSNFANLRCLKNQRKK